MNWIPDLAAALPAPRDDEPPELRRRIIAELRDHLECAFQRELVLTGNTDEAIRRVREKFGDPAQLARKLWFEALKEKIMSQRLMLVCVGMLAAACMAMGIFSWKTAEQSALATQALVEHLDQLVLASDMQRSLDWVNVKVKLVTETGEEAPEGFTVEVDDQNTINMTGIEVKRISDNGGQLDFGLLIPKRYNLRVSSPWGEHVVKQFFVRAGESPWIETVVCPSGPVEETSLQFDVDWPESLKRQRLGLLVTVTSPERRFEDVPWFRERTALGFTSTPSCYLIDEKMNVRRLSSQHVTELGTGLSRFEFPAVDPLNSGTVPLRGSHQRVSIWGAVLFDRPLDSSAGGGAALKSFAFVPADPAVVDASESLKRQMKLTLSTDRLEKVKLTPSKDLVNAVHDWLRKIEKRSEPVSGGWRYERDGDIEKLTRG